MNKYSFILLTFTAFLLMSLTSCTPTQKGDSYLISSVQPETTETTVTATIDSKGRSAELLSAFYGLEALPNIASFRICAGAGGQDGMPLIFSHEIDPDTLEAGDFRVITASGRIGSINCITLEPADDTGELRTGLLTGDYGSASDQPVSVEVVGNLLSLDNSLNFKGVKVEVTPLEVGPTMVWAEVVPESEWELGKEATEQAFGGGSGCPVGTKQVVRATWGGGVTKPGGAEIDDTERVQYKVTIEKEDGSLSEVTPFAIGDLGDGDNIHELCLDEIGKAQSIFFPAGFMTDPREDLNPDSTISILSGL